MQLKTNAADYRGLTLKAAGRWGLSATAAERRELIINCLAILALLAVGVVWGPI